jgi:hypothetical protein
MGMKSLCEAPDVRMDGLVRMSPVPGLRNETQKPRTATGMGRRRFASIEYSPEAMYTSSEEACLQYQ